ncbi:MAG: dihydrodipicolinate reductase C-terminal domain-containing protein [Candidatus Acidiferrales bacterium]
MSATLISPNAAILNAERPRLKRAANTRKNLAIVGYGKMGRLIEQLAPEYGFAVHLRLDSASNSAASAITPENFRDVDVAVEFSNAAAAARNIERLAALGINTVVGTTGWTAHLDQAKSAVEDSGVGLVWSPNYSIGVNVFLQLAAEASRRIARYREYGAWAWEIHHSAKKDAPSGTLLKVVNEMKAADPHREISVSSNRAGAHPGTHEVGFDSAADSITIRHTARSREGFARGALTAAQWVIGKHGWFEFRDVLSEH